MTCSKSLLRLEQAGGILSLNGDQIEYAIPKGNREAQALLEKAAKTRGTRENRIKSNEINWSGWNRVATHVCCSGIGCDPVIEYHVVAAAIGYRVTHVAAGVSGEDRREGAPTRDRDVIQFYQMARNAEGVWSR